MNSTRTRPLLAALAATAVAVSGVVGTVAAAPSAEAAPSSIRVITHNLAKKPGALTAVIAKKRATGGPEVVLLQEVCGSMRSRIANDLGQKYAWHVRREGHCPDGSNIGEIAVWTGGDVVDRTTPDFTRHPDQPSDQTYGAACVVFRYAGKKNKACSTHLAAGDTKGAVRAHGTAQLRSLAEGWKADGTRVIIGGDFNAEPKSAEMAAMYGVGDGAQGRFREIHQSAKPTTVRTGKVTLWQRKIDYVFGYMTAFHVKGGSEATCNSTVRNPDTGCTPSNHRILWGTLPLG